jgi:hypothetical protein
MGNPKTTPKCTSPSTADPVKVLNHWRRDLNKRDGLRSVPRKIESISTSSDISDLKRQVADAVTEFEENIKETAAALKAAEDEEWPEELKPKLRAFLEKSRKCIRSRTLANCQAVLDFVEMQMLFAHAVEKCALAAENALKATE